MTAGDGTVADGAPRALVLGGETARGGEGVVHVVPGEPGLLAKVWHEPDPRRAAKVSLMATHPAALALADAAAWPLFPLLGPGGIVGFAMRRVDGHRGIHDLFTPKSRRTQFPRARWPFLVRAATNVARAFEAAHAAGVVLGDVNHSSVLVDRRATVTLIDCDSFQFEVEGRVFTCDVGVDGYTPPELQGILLSGVERTVGHDAFGLAVLVFQLLFLGRHPFSGVFDGRGEMTVSRAVRECRYAYATDRDTGMSPPPGSMRPANAGPAIADMFERAFGREAAAGKVGRPGAAEWVAVLSELESSLEPCARDADHHARPGAPCPFCALEHQTGAPAFASLSSLPVVEVPDAGQALRRLDALPPRLRDDLVASAGRRARAAGTVGVVPAWARAKGAFMHGYARACNPVRWVALGLCLWHPPEIPWFPDLILWGLLAWAFYMAPRIAGDLARRLARPETLAFEAATRRMREAVALYAPATTYARALSGALACRKEIEAADAERGSLLEGLPASLRDWLAAHPVSASGVEGLGEARTASLASCGVRTAADVTERALGRVDGVGPVTARRLLAWRVHVEGAYRAALASPATRSRVTAAQMRLAGRKRGAIERLESCLTEAEGEIARLRAGYGAFDALVVPPVAAYLAARDARDAVLAGWKAKP